MDRPFIGAIIGAVATVYGAKKQKKAQKKAAAEARKQEEFAAAEAEKDRQFQLEQARRSNASAPSNALTMPQGAAMFIPPATKTSESGGSDVSKYLPYIGIGAAALVAVAILRR